MHFPTPQSSLFASPSPRMASIVNDLPIVLEDVALLGGLGLSPLLLLLDVRACCRSAEYMNNDDGDGAVVPVAGPRTGGGYCWCRKSRKCENEVYPSSGFCIIMLCMGLSARARSGQGMTGVLQASLSWFWNSFQVQAFKNRDHGKEK
jgi:hypothetical protein